jgi:hypothetical protein
MKCDRLLTLLLIAGVFGLLSLSLTQGQSIIHSFEGDEGAGLAACQTNPLCSRQPEMNVAVDGRRVVQLTRQNVRIYDYSGKLLRTTPVVDFVRSAGLDPMTRQGTGPIEPHIVFDEFLQRWLITLTCRNDCLLVSDSADPAGKWGGVYLSCANRGPCLERNPTLKIGYDKNGIYTCGAHIGDDNPHTIRGYANDCFAIPAAEVSAIAHGVTPSHISRAHNLPLDTMPAIDQNPLKAPRDPVFFVTKSCDHEAPAACQKATNFRFDWIVDSFTWTGTGGIYNVGGEQVVKTDVGSARSKWLYNLPCCGSEAAISQAGSNVRLRAAESHRLTNLVQFGSHLHGVLNSGPCNSACGDQGADANNVMFWMDLDCSNAARCVVSHTAKISGPAFNTEFASIGVDSQGNLGIVAASASPKASLGILLWTRRVSDPLNSFTGPTPILAGTQPYTCESGKNVVPIGNSVGILTLRDPLDGSKLWTTQQWSNDAKPCVWNTRIVQYQVAAGSRLAVKKKSKE